MTELTMENVERVLSRVRPYLQTDDGDVEVISIREGGIVNVRLLGNCRNCPLSLVTLRAGIERALMQEISSVTRIESVN